MVSEGSSSTGRIRKKAKGKTVINAYVKASGSGLLRKDYTQFLSAKSWFRARVKALCSLTAAQVPCK